MIIVPLSMSSKYMQYKNQVILVGVLHYVINVSVLCILGITLLLLFTLSMCLYFLYLPQKQDSGPDDPPAKKQIGVCRWCHRRPREKSKNCGRRRENFGKSLRLITWISAPGMNGWCFRGLILSFPMDICILRD